MRVLVTGGSGFLGRHVVPLLIARDVEVTALARSDGAATTLDDLGATPVRGDLDDPEGLKGAFRASGADVLVNLASLGFGHAESIIRAAETTGFSRAIFISTTSIFTSLDTPTKPIRIRAEESIKNSALEWTILRPTMIYGAPGDRNMERLIKLLTRTSIVPVPGGGRGLQQPVHVDDLAEVVAAGTARHQASFAAFDIAGPVPLTLREVIEQAGAAVGKSAKLVPLPLTPVRALVSLYERKAATPRIKAEQIERLAEDKAFDISPARAAFDYDPRSFADGIREEALLLQ